MHQSSNFAAAFDGIRAKLLSSVSSLLRRSARPRNSSGILNLDLEDALSKPGCPVCWLLRRSDLRYLDSLLYEFVNDVGVREEIRQSLGFCNHHAWIMYRIASDRSVEAMSWASAPLGIAIIYLDLTETLMERLEPARKNGPKPRTVTYKLDRKSCPICTWRDGSERHYLEAVLKNIGEPVFAAQYSASDGLCAIHLLTSLSFDISNENKTMLVRIEIEKLKGLAYELREFIRKQDYLHNQEGFGKEADSWLRALAKVSGNQFTGPKLSVR